MASYFCKLISYEDNDDDDDDDKSDDDPAHTWAKSMSTAALPIEKRI